MNGYSICLNEWALDKDIKDELGLLLIISSLTAERGYCFASNEYLAKMFDVSDVTISRKIKKLERKNYINIEYKKRGCEVIARYIRLVINTLDYQKEQSSVNINDNRTINKYVKDNNTSNNIISINNEGATAPAPKKTVKKFVPPTREEIIAYCQSKGYNIDVDHFISTYSPDGGAWHYKDGSPVKDWKRCCVTWAYNGKKYDAQRSAGKGNLYGNENDCAQVYAGIL